MKILRLLFSIFLITESLCAGAQVFIDTNKVWSMYTCNDTGACDRRVIELKGDTLIGSTHYTKFVAIQDSANISAWMPVGAREDGTAKRVYFYNNGAEYLAYDFSLNVNDTFRTDIGSCHVEMVVNSMDSITLVTGEKRKRIFFSSDTWIEGIGSTFGPIYPALFSCEFDLFPELICEFENDTEKYHQPAYEDCFYSFIGINEIGSELSFNFFPNPVLGKTSFTVSYLSQSDDANLIICDMAGREIIHYSLPANGGKKQLKLPAIERGLYVARLRAGNAEGILKFIVE